MDSNTYLTLLKQAKASRTLSGDLCIIMGWICSAIGVATTLFLITQGSSIYIIAGSLGISVLLAFAGAPIAAIGSQTNENKKQTEILYCQANFIEYLQYQASTAGKE